MPGVASEVGRLESVIVHRPSIELTRLTPLNKERLLFDDILWVERAQEEHDRLTTLLRDSGAEVLLFRDLLAETLTDAEVRGRVIDAIVTPAVVGERLSTHLRAEFRICEMDRLLDALLGGVVASELPDWGVGQLFADFAADRHEAVIRPLPNLMFMRDNAAWVGNGLVLGVLAYPVRRQESLMMSAIYRHHPRFRDAEFAVWYGDGEHDEYPATIEGGDVLVLGERTVLVGSGERTAPASIEALAARLFAADAVDRVLVVRFPRERSFMHLDTVVTMVDHDALNVFSGVLPRMEVYEVTPDPRGGLRVAETAGLVSAIEAALDRRMRLITTGDDGIGQIREQWEDGNNTLAVAPGVVIAYARNRAINGRLIDHGIEVLEFDASELCRGRGGSRCLTQPIARA